MIKEKRSYVSKMLKVMGENTIRFRLTEKKVDRDGDVILPDGIMLDEFKKNPIVLFGHGYGSDTQGRIPIGKIDINSFEITKEYMDADVIFDATGKDNFAAMIFDKVKNGYLNTGSIRFMPKVYDFDPVIDGQTGVTVTSCELIEYSIEPIPSNTGAVAMRSAVKSFQKELEEKFPQKNIAELFKTDTEDVTETTQDLKGIDNKLDAIKTLITNFVVKNKLEKIDELAPIEKEVKEINSEEVKLGVDDYNEITNNLKSINKV